MADDLKVAPPGGKSDFDVLSEEDETEGKGEVKSDEEDKDKKKEDEEEVDKGKKPEEEGEEEDEEAKEKVKEEEEEDETETESLGRPSTKTITAKYPEFFKDFPSLRHAFFREQKFAEIFPTVEDAQEAKERVEDFESFTDLVHSGDVAGFLGTLQETDSSVAQKFVSNFLPGLYKTNADMYFSIATPVVENFLKALYNHGVQSGNEDIKNSALQAALWGFNDVEIASSAKSSVGASRPSADKGTLDQERQDFYAERYVTFRADVTTGASKQLRAIVLKGFDPEEVFSADLKEILVDRVVDKIDKALESDREHMSRIGSLWKRAARAGYAGDWKSRITSAYLERARTAMPAIRKRIVDAALTSKQSQSERQAERGKLGADRREIPGSRTSKGDTDKSPSAKEVDWSKTSDMDFLEGRIATK